MGKKRPYAEIKDGFAKPSLEKKQVNVKDNGKGKRKNGEVQKQRSSLVRAGLGREGGTYADVCE